jgi:hypothetical protein
VTSFSDDDSSCGNSNDESDELPFIVVILFSLKVELRDIFRIGFLFFRRPEPSPMEDLADETSVVVIDSSLAPGFRKGYAFKLFIKEVIMMVI